MRSAPAEPLSILVVDDDSALIRTLSDILEHHGYSATTAATGKEGLRLAEQNRPALAVVDLRLPDMDGMELVSRLHELSSLTEVVVLTGNASIESAVAALREHSIDYLLKPVQVERLLQVASVATERWQRRQAEERLRESDERFRAVIESDMLGIMFWDMGGRIYDANDAFFRITGYTRTDIASGGLDWRRISPPEWHEADERKAREMAESGAIEPYEKQYRRGNGELVDVLVGGTTLMGRQDSGVAFVLDISDRKAAERKLEARARQQQAIATFGQRALEMDDIPELLQQACSLVSGTLGLPMVFVLERRSDGEVQVVRATIGWSTPSHTNTLVPVTESTQSGYTLLHMQPVTVTDFGTDARFPHSAPIVQGARSGVTVPIPGAVTPFGVLGAHDRVPRQFTQDDVHFLQAIAHIVGTTIERARTEAGFRQAQRMEAVGRLAGGVAHDFNNVLTAITGYSEILRSTMQPGEQNYEDVEEILKAADRAAGLTRQLLAFSRQQVLQPRLVNLNDVVTDVEKMLRRLIGEDVEFVVSLDPTLGATKADVGQLEQVLLNLCMNARDAMPGGGVLTVETRNTEMDRGSLHGTGAAALPEGRYVMLAVSDNGIGMDAETRARIYEPFFTTKAPEKGTGLGLATVHGIVKQSGGEIAVYSEPGQGTTFKIYLPLVADAAAPAQSDKQPRPRGGTETILLVEDEEPVRRLAQRVLESEGYTVLSAQDGAEAQRSFDARREQGLPVHLLVTDMVMPGINGRQLADTLRKKSPGLRVLYLSGYTNTTVQRRGLLDGGEVFFQKPFSNEALVRKVRETLDAAVTQSRTTDA